MAKFCYLDTYSFRWAQHAAVQIEMVVVTNRQARGLRRLRRRKVKPSHVLSREFCLRWDRACQVQALGSLKSAQACTGDRLQLSPSRCLTHPSGNKVLQSAHCVVWKQIESATLRDAWLCEERSVPEF